VVRVDGCRAINHVACRLVVIIEGLAHAE
jgi:hypothetical protein